MLIEAENPYFKGRCLNKSTSLGPKNTVSHTVYQPRYRAKQLIGNSLNTFANIDELKSYFLAMCKTHN